MAGSRFALLAVVCAVCALPIAALAQTAGDAAAGGSLRLAAPVRQAKHPAAVYIVKMREPGAATYKGGTAGYAATKPSPGRKLDSSSGAVRSYVAYLENTHDQALTSVGAGGGKLYSFRYALNGFAARLTTDQASRLARRGDVERIWPDTDQRLSTNNSAIFLGLEDPSGGLRADLGLQGEDIVIGFIDSGITPTHPSLLDVERHVPRACESRWSRASWLGRWLCHAVRRNPPTTLQFEPPQGFHGICQAGDGFPASTCNNKIIGARYYIEGFLARHELDPNEFVSPKDADGHGTHIATIAAGNPTSAQLFGARVARVSGIAPRARIAAYKACWLKTGERRATCATSDLARAIDDAVADGVDIINYSVGSLETDLTAPDDLALLDAFDAGILAVVAAGNDGPDYATIGSPSSAPWVLTVGASTQQGTRFREAIEVTSPDALAGRILMREASFTPRLSAERAIEAALILADDGAAGGSLGGSERDACQPLVNDLDGAIALIERGQCGFAVKLQHAASAGAVAAVVYSTSGAPIVMNGDRGSVTIPAVMIGVADGQRLADALAGGETVEARLAAGLFIEGRDTGNIVADFSSRGPGLSEPDFLKPDVTAPGVEILGGHTPEVANGLRGETFQYLSGTSMAAPEAAGVAALLKEAHPEWSAAAIKSALTTSARRNVVRPGNEEPADPFEVGAGHIDPNRAIDPGLVYDSDLLDHAAFLCGLRYTPFADEECNELALAGYSFEPRELNLPSFSLSRLITGDTIVRRVTNVGPPATYVAETEAPLGMRISVEPQSLSLGTGESATFTLAFTKDDAATDEWAFGELAWTDGSRRVASPIAVMPVTMRSPEDVFLTGSAGYFEVPVSFGYSGQYFPGVHGLRAPFIEDGFVDEDETNSFSFRFDRGVTAHLIDVPPEQMFARFALFDEFTDGADDLDLYLFHCPNNECVQIAESGGFTSEEQIDLVLPEPGVYAVLVHGFDTDPAGGAGAHYTLHAWSLGISDYVGNFDVFGPAVVTDGEHTVLELEWGGLAPATRYLAAISHIAANEPYTLTIVEIRSP